MDGDAGGDEGTDDEYDFYDNFIVANNVEY